MPPRPSAQAHRRYGLRLDADVAGDVTVRTGGGNARIDRIPESRPAKAGAFAPVPASVAVASVAIAVGFVLHPRGLRSGREQRAGTRYARAYSECGEAECAGDRCLSCDLLEIHHESPLAARVVRQWLRTNLIQSCSGCRKRQAQRPDIA